MRFTNHAGDALPRSGGIDPGDVLIWQGDGEREVLMVVLYVHNRGRPGANSWAACEFGNPNVFQIYVVVAKGSAVPTSGSYEICTSLRRLKTQMSPDELRFVLDLQPSWQHYISVLGGIPLPDDALSTLQSPASSLPVLDILLLGMRLAYDLRKRLHLPSSDQNADQRAWCASTEIESIVQDYLIDSEARTGARHPSMIRSCHLFEAHVLGLALHGDDASLWSLMLVMVAQARMGAKFAALSGAGPGLAGLPAPL